MSDNIRNLRNILRKTLQEGTDRFAILKDVAELVSTGNTAAQEMVLRVFARRKEFQEYNDVIIELVKQVGLYPYLSEEELSLRDMLALEMHRVDGLNEVVFHSSQAEVYHHLMDGKNVILSAPTSYGKSLIIDSVIASGKYNNLVVIVPSIALIDETRKRLSRFKEHYKIIINTHLSLTTELLNSFVLILYWFQEPGS